jgi:hypothetical protein
MGISLIDERFSFQVYHSLIYLKLRFKREREREIIHMNYISFYVERMREVT